MKSLLNKLHELIWSLPFIIFLASTLWTFAISKLTNTRIGKRVFDNLSATWKTIYILHLVISSLAILTTIVFAGIKFGLLPTLLILLLIGLLIRIIIIPFIARQQIAERITTYYQVTPIVNLLLTACYAYLIWGKYV